jgi:hypothetical protein
MTFLTVAWTIIAKFSVWLEIRKLDQIWHSVHSSDPETSFLFHVGSVQINTAYICLVTSKTVLYFEGFQVKLVGVLENFRPRRS